MATNEVLVKNNVPFLFHSSAHSPTAINDLTSQTPTTVDLTLDVAAAGLADTEGVNSDQVDLGATRAERWAVVAALEWFAAVTAGLTVDFYWSYSDNSVVTDGNLGRVDGVDGAWTGDGASEDESARQLQWIGTFITTNFASGAQIADVGTFAPKGRYGQMVIVNNSGTLLCGTDDIESSVLMSPIVPDIQAAA